MFFNPTKNFWKYRKKCLKHEKGRIKILYYFYLVLCKKINRTLHSGIPVSREINQFIAPHGLSGIYISKGAQIEEGCTIFQQVTIGSNTLPDSKKLGAPKIGKNVYIGAGAKIIGSIKVGDNVRVGANCVVVEDVPNNSTIVMNKPRIIVHKQKRENRFEKWDSMKGEEK